MGWDEFKDKMNTAASILRWELANLWGHVSVRTPNGGGFILMHLRPPEDPSVPADEVLEYDLEGKLVSGRRDQPDEVYFYSYPYKIRKDVGAVIHCHPELALAVIAAGKKIQAFHHHSIKFSGGVPVAPWLYGFWPEHGKKVVKHLGKGSALMIRGHGALIVGPTLEEACITTVQLERAARLILAAGALGKISPFPERYIKEFRTVAASRPPRPGAPPRVPLEWRYYESLVKAGQVWSKL